MKSLAYPRYKLGHSSNMELYRLIVDEETQDLDVVEKALKNADPTWKDSCGFTMLHWAASLDRSDIACLLLDKGYNPAELDNNCETPAQLARSKGHDSIAGLIEHYRSGGPAIVNEKRFYKLADDDFMAKFNTWPIC